MEGRVTSGATREDTMKRIQIRYPDRLPEAERRITDTLRLHREGSIPSSIDGWMIVVPLKYALRAIYGSDLGAILGLLRMYLEGQFDQFTASVSLRAYFIPWFFAIVWTFVWGWIRWLRSPGPLAWLWGRQSSPEPYLCEDCGWRGPLRWTVHEYERCGDEDVEPVDLCPACGSEDLVSRACVHFRSVQSIGDRKP